MDRTTDSYTRAANINSYIDANAQIAIPSLDITTGTQSEWFYVTVPSTTTGTMVVKEQSSNLSSLSPKLSVYTTSLGLLGSATYLRLRRHGDGLGRVGSSLARVTTSGRPATLAARRPGDSGSS